MLSCLFFESRSFVLDCMRSKYFLVHGLEVCNMQSYWSMKYHSIIMDSLDKYAGLGFGGGSFYFDDIHWFRG